MDKKNESKSTLWSKIWKSLASLAVVYGLLSPMRIEFNFEIWVFILIILIFFAFYWHILEKLDEKILNIKNYFFNLRKDIDEIKIHISEDKKNDKNKKR